MVKIYSGLEYCAIGSLNKTMNLANAVQLKMKDLRGGVSLSDSGAVIDQAKSIASALKNGNAVLVDEKDIIETAKIDMAPTKKVLRSSTSAGPFIWVCLQVTSQASNQRA